MPDARERFSDRVKHYAKYRPGYPPGVIHLLEQSCGLGSQSAVADIGAGTGIFTRLLLDTGCRVYGIEPNREMRVAAEESLAAYPRFTSVAGDAEDTRLAEASINLITVAQAFHWFDRSAARREFVRILRPDGCVALIWNERLVDTTPFLREYEALLHRHSADYAQVDHRNVSVEAVDAFFRPGRFERAAFPNEQRFDFEGLKGRVLSSSYMPAETDPAFPAVLDDLHRLFREYARGGQVVFEYVTNVYYGKLRA